jgi:uncharacterized protein (TIGR04255 family)
MIEPTRFPHAPITEALLDIRVNLPEHVNLAQLATFQDLIKDQYPSRHERVFWQSNILTPTDFVVGEESVQTIG